MEFFGFRSWMSLSSSSVLCVTEGLLRKLASSRECCLPLPYKSDHRETRNCNNDDNSNISLSVRSFWCLTPSGSSPKGDGHSGKTSISPNSDTTSLLVQGPPHSTSTSTGIVFHLPNGLPLLFGPSVSFKYTFLQTRCCISSQCGLTT